MSEQDMRLEPFCAVATCAKCRGDRAAEPSAWQWRYCVGFCLRGEEGRFERVTPRDKVVRAHLHVRCACCGHERLMQCADDAARVPDRQRAA